MAEVVRKPQVPPTEVLSVRVDASLRKEYAKAREVAHRQDIDLTAMVSAALRDVFTTIIAASGPGKIAAISERRTSATE